MAEDISANQRIKKVVDMLIRNQITEEFAISTIESIKEAEKEDLAMYSQPQPVNQTPAPQPEPVAQAVVQPQPDSQEPTSSPEPTISEILNDMANSQSEPQPDLAAQAIDPRVQRIISNGRGFRRPVQPVQPQSAPQPEPIEQAVVQPQTQQPSSINNSTGFVNPNTPNQQPVQPVSQPEPVAQPVQPAPQPEPAAQAQQPVEPEPAQPDLDLNAQILAKLDPNGEKMDKLLSFTPEIFKKVKENEVKKEKKMKLKISSQKVLRQGLYYLVTALVTGLYLWATGAFGDSFGSFMGSYGPNILTYGGAIIAAGGIGFVDSFKKKIFDKPKYEKCNMLKSLQNFMNAEELQPKLKEISEHLLFYNEAEKRRKAI